MPQPTPDPFGALKAQTQLTLIDFLHVDMDLAFTFLQIARTAGKRNPERRKASLENARAALQAIRRLQGRIIDRRECAKINVRANELETALNEFSHSAWLEISQRNYQTLSRS
jgi:hypothetical protein